MINWNTYILRILRTCTKILNSTQYKISFQFCLLRISFKEGISMYRDNTAELVRLFYGLRDAKND